MAELCHEARHSGCRQSYKVLSHTTKAAKLLSNPP